MSSKRKRAGRRLDTGDQQEDAFLAGILEFSDWAQRHRDLLMFSLIGLAVVVAGTLYYISDRRNTGNRAVGELERIQQTVQIGNSEAAKGELETYLAQYGGTPYAAEARLILGGLHLESGDAASAISALEPIGRSPSSQLGLQAGVLLAVAYEQSGQLDEAVDTYLEVADRSDMTFQIREARLDAARLLAARGDYGEARDLYEEVLDGLEDTDPQRGLLEMRIAELDAHG